MSYEIFENLSLTAELGVTVLDTSGKTLFSSSIAASSADFLDRMLGILDCAENDRISLLYGCYQARRFGGRYVFLAPSGLAYCASPLAGDNRRPLSCAIAGPFLMMNYDEYMDIDVKWRYSVDEGFAETIAQGIHAVPLKTPALARAISEQLFVCASYHSLLHAVNPPEATQSFGDISPAYSIEKEDELLSAISMGDVNTASAMLNNILGQILFHANNNLEILRSRVVELTVLLSRAALKGGANIDAIFGLNYSYLHEIDALSSVEDIVLWLHQVTRRFAQHVFDYAGSKHVNVIYQAIDFIKCNYAKKITLQDVADSVFLSLTYFSKVFKEETGQTPGAYITAVRIEEAKKLLYDYSINIVDIPEMIGFESQSYFTKVFKKSEGCTPGRFRKRRLENAGASMAES